MKSYEAKQKLILEELKEFSDFLESFASDLQNKSEEIQRKINETIKELNNSRKELKNVYEEWEKLKVEIVYFQNFSGKVQNFLCKNSLNTQKEMCKNVSAKNN
ncbi:hypothetical protein MSUIS_06050 [Mycoplasma suis KI3806]|uniref:Uncharacterized protein n=2 Tax=Mycoplasma suis TaxID=57372 RepID=F0V217_MYCS3|nr:hypothetical protein MSUIS_06050 [Mycoplasma suis KI3806]